MEQLQFLWAFIGIDLIGRGMLQNARPTIARSPFRVQSDCEDNYRIQKTNSMGETKVLFIALTRRVARPCSALETFHGRALRRISPQVSAYRTLRVSGVFRVR